MSVSVSRSRGATGEADSTVIAVRYSYEGKPPGPKKRVEMAKALLVEALQRLNKGEVADLGFQEDGVRRFRIDKMEA